MTIWFIRILIPSDLWQKDIYIAQITIYCNTGQSRSSHPFVQGIFDTQKWNWLLRQIFSWNFCINNSVRLEPPIVDNGLMSCKLLQDNCEELDDQYPYKERTGIPHKLQSRKIVSSIPIQIFSQLLPQGLPHLAMQHNSI